MSCSLDFSLPQVVRTLGHVAVWARYRVTGASPEPSRPPAQVTYNGSRSEPARVEGQCG
jgi:hypothetical protein